MSVDISTLLLCVMRTILMLLTPREVARVIRTCSFHFRSQNRDQRKITYAGGPPSSPHRFSVIFFGFSWEFLKSIKRIFSYEYFDIKDKQKVGFLEFVIMYVPVCLVSL